MKPITQQSQTCHLRNAGFPDSLISSLGYSLLKDLRKPLQGQEPLSRKKKEVAIIPYIHGVSYMLKRIVGQSGVELVFSAPNKLNSICCKVNSENPVANRYTKKHAKPLVQCQHEVIYKIPLSCWHSYVGQTGRCHRKHACLRNSCAARLCFSSVACWLGMQTGWGERYEKPGKSVAGNRIASAHPPLPSRGRKLIFLTARGACACALIWTVLADTDTSQQCKLLCYRFHCCTVVNVCL